MSGDLGLLRPWWLLALPVLALAGWWLATRRAGLGDWQQASDPALLRAMGALGLVDRAAGRGPLEAMLCSVFMTVLALSGPSVERRDTLSFRNLDAVLFVIDGSSSVTGDKSWPRMQSAGRLALASLGTRPGGLIVFGGDAYVASDLTRDHVQLGQTLSLIDGETVPDPGSRPERALALAAEMLAGAEIVAGDVILFTDGAGLGPETLRLAAGIAGQGARLSLVAPDAPGPDFATHAAAGGGRVFTANEAVVLGEWLDTAARTRLAAQDYPLLYHYDMGRYLLFGALIPLLWLFRRQGA